MGERVRLLLGDCLEVLPTLEAGSVDAVVTDPPYGQTNEAYDSPIAFSPDVWRECFRVCKPNAALISFAGSPTYHRIASGIEAAGWQVRQMWAWVYRDGMITSAYPREGFDRLAPAMDPICYATKGKVLLNLQRQGTRHWDRQRITVEPMGYSERASNHGTGSANGHWPRSLVADEYVDGFEYFTLSRTSPLLQIERTEHPNQKPLALLNWLVGKLSPGSVILDPFCGSGTTGEAALGWGCQFIGIDTNPAYLDMARQRLERVTPAHPGLLPPPPAREATRSPQRTLFDLQEASQ